MVVAQSICLITYIISLGLTLKKIKVGVNFTYCVRSFCLLCGCGLKAFLRRTNRNLEQDENSELVHHLHEKQLRHERCIRGILSPGTSHVPSSYHGSAENIDRKLQNFMYLYVISPELISCQFRLLIFAVKCGYD